ncbi:MAG: reverse transcriptase family protein [Syntrophobacteraceae bacterium]
MPNLYFKRSLDIRDRKHLAYRLGASPEYLEELASRAESLYAFKLEEKKSGGYREISMPKRELKGIQKKIEKLLKEVKLHDSANCGIRKKSNFTNAVVHCGQKWVFSLDFTKFFPNISHHMVYHMFRAYMNCSPAVARLLTRLSTVKEAVPQGGPMSVSIANLVCLRLDDRLHNLAGKFSLAYTRYCDDLCFSGSCIPDIFKDKVRQIVLRSGFFLNSKKESCTPRHDCQIVTGLCVNRRKPSVPRGKKRHLRNESFLFNKYESQCLPKQLRQKRQMQIDGKKNYINYVEKAGVSN